MSEPDTSGSPEEEDSRAVAALLRLVVPDASPEHLAAGESAWCWLTRARAGGVAVVRARGELGDESTFALRRIVEGACQPLPTVLIFDWREVTFLDACPCGIFVRFIRRQEEAPPVILVLCRAPRVVRRWQ